MKESILLHLLGLFAAVAWCEQNYEVTNERLDPFKGTFETIADFHDLKTINRERAINGTMKFLEDLNNEEFFFDMEVWSSPASDGNYKKVGMDVPKTAICDGMKQFYTKFVQPSLIFGENTDFPFIPPEGLCPMPAGTYYFHNLQFNTDDWPNEIPRGLLKFVLKFYKKQHDVGGMALVINIKDE